jgi:hypothetical protein
MKGASETCRAQNHHPYPVGPPCQEPNSIRRLGPLSTFAENSWLYSPAMARLTPLPMVETGLYHSRIVCFVRFAGALPLTVAASRVFHLIRSKRISPDGVFAPYRLIKVNLRLQTSVGRSERDRSEMAQDQLQGSVLIIVPVL